MAKKLSPIEEAKLRAILADPVEWAKAFVVSNDAASKKYGPWVARDYQEEMLRDPSLKKVYRCGRRCLPEWVCILDPYTGELKTVGELYKEGKANVAAMDPEDYSIKKQTNCPVSYNGEKEVFRVTLESGAKIDATGNHPLYTPNGWKEIDDLKPGDLVAVPAKLDIFEHKDVTMHDYLESYAQIINSQNKYYDNSIDPFITTASKEDVLYFLNELFKKRSWASINEKIEIGYYSKSEELIRIIAHLLLRFGIHCIIEERYTDWTLIINDRQSLLTFMDEIGFSIPKCNKKDARYAFEHYAEDTDSERTEGQIMWVKIRTIISIGEWSTYDLTVPEYHNFIANDIITHNTGKSETMIIEGLHKAYTHKNFRILYITPYENQVNLIFMRMREIIHDSPLIKNEVVRMKNSPYMIEFKNGSSVMGFTTGASSGSGAASIRGQRADFSGPLNIVNEG